jgi:hypothetical protein
LISPPLSIVDPDGQRHGLYPGTARTPVAERFQVPEHSAQMYRARSPRKGPGFAAPPPALRRMPGPTPSQFRNPAGSCTIQEPGPYWPTSRMPK